MTIVPVRRRVFARAPQSFGHQHCQLLDPRLVFDETEINFEPGPYHENVVGEYNIEDAWASLLNRGDRDRFSSGVR
ncbi:hypothetical protein I6F26_31910 [Ensifer sp. IC3342]|nr:hypothetical protein [Ensifer sp. BRP08]MCA1451082.1 hypothetical protein [Ensifer sp. IC3342]